MNILLSIIIMAFEILYYSLFMKFTRKEGNILKYILMFTIINIFFCIVGTNNLYSYLLLILLILFGLKYFIKIKTNLYDMLVIFIMLLVKLIIELPFYVILINLISNISVIIITDIFKLLIVYLLKNKLNIFYKKLKIKWDNNNFYIRYIFCIMMFIYTIASCIFLIVKLF